jgi:hypothetical protein
MWSSSPNASFSPGPNVASPAITFTAPGQYTLYVTATNTAGTSSSSMVIGNVGTCPKAPVCLDTIRMIKNIDTLTVYQAPTNSLVIGCQSGWTGFLTGTNCYKDKEFAQYFPPSTYSDTPNPQVNSMIVLFYKPGTKATASTANTMINCKVYSGSPATGPSQQIAVIADNLQAISSSTTATTQVQYCGAPNYVFTNTVIIPYKFNFAMPAIIPAVGFFGAVETPYSSAVDSIQIFSNTKTNLSTDSSAWFLQFSNNWRTLKNNRGAKVQLAILPQITCRPVVGIAEPSVFASNIAIMPNPSNGIFNVIFTLPKEEKVKMKIYNSLGQMISDDELRGVTNNVFTVDLSSKSNGVYFLEVSNGNEKLTKKIVVTH